MSDAAHGVNGLRHQMGGRTTAAAWATGIAHVDTLLLQQVLTEPAWASRLMDEDRRGLTALFWSNVNPYGTFRLDMDIRLDLLPATVPGPRPAATGRTRAVGEAS